MIFYQLFDHESSTFTYLLACEKTLEGIIIDSVLEKAERDITLIKQLGLKLLYSIETHIHADHITGASLLKKEFGSRSIASINAPIKCLDRKVANDELITFGNYSLKVLETQGHTNSCMSLLIEDKIFTGDLIFIRGTGRTDFQEGNSALMYDNITNKIFTLPPTTKIYPGHDYNGQTHSTVELEMKFNPRIGNNKTKAEFITIMNDLKLSEPKKIAVAVPANLNCGQVQ